MALCTHAVLALAGDDDACKQRPHGVFRAAVVNDPVFAHAVDADNTRHALDEVAEYGAFHDGFLVTTRTESVDKSSSESASWLEAISFRDSKESKDIKESEDGREPVSELSESEPRLS